MVGGGLSISLPGIWQEFYLRTETIKKRITAFEILYPLVYEGRSELKLPLEFQVIPAKQKHHQGREAFGSWHIRATAQPHSVSLDFAYSHQSGVYNSKQYRQYRTFSNEAIAAMTPEIHCLTVQKVVMQK
jgi:hypothetical protein